MRQFAAGLKDLGLQQGDKVRAHNRRSYAAQVQRRVVAECVFESLLLSAPAGHAHQSPAEGSKLASAVDPGLRAGALCTAWHASSC